MSTHLRDRRSALVFFFGPNGAGKSTQMDMLIAALKKQNIKVHKSWVASHHLFVWFLGTILAKLGYPKDTWTKVNPHLPPVVDFHFIAKNMGSSKSLLIAFELFNLIITDLFRVRIPKLLGYWVIVEKYIPVTIVDFHLIDVPFSSSIISFLLRLIPKDAHGIFLHVDYATLLKRRGEKTEPKTYLELQNLVGKWYSKSYHCLEIDTSKTNIERAHELVMNYLDLV